MKYHLCWLTLFLVGCTSRTAPEPIWIGHLIPQSGSEGRNSEEAIQAMQLALEEAREQEWSVAGRPVAVRHVDASDPAQARAEAVRLLAVNRVTALIVGPGVPAAEEVVAAARTHGAPVIVVDEMAAPPPGGHAILLGPDPVQRGKTLADYARTKLKLDHMLLLVDRGNPISAAMATAFSESWRKRGGKLDEQKPEVAPKSHRDPVILAAPSARTDEKLPSELTILDATVYTPQARLPEKARDWQKRYEKRYHQPPGRAAILGHDALAFILDGLENTDSPEREALLKDLAGRESFDSLTGELTWTDDGRPRRTLFIVRRHSGKEEVVEKVSASAK